MQQTGAGKKAVRIHRNGSRSGQGMQYRNRMTLYEGKISRLYLEGDFITYNLKPLKSKQKGLAAPYAARGSSSLLSF